MFLIISIIYRPVEQLLSRTISARRARGLRGRAPAADAGRRSRPASRRCSWSSRWRGASGSRTRSSTARRRCTGCWSSAWSPTRRATSRAAGWPGTSASGSTAGSCCWSRARAACSRSPSWSGIASGQGVVALGHRGGAAGLAGGRAVGAARARPAPPPARGGGAAGELGSQHALRRRGAGDHGRRAGAAQRAGRGRRRHEHRRRAGRLRVQRAADHARAAAALPGDPDLAAPPPLRARGDRRPARTSRARCASRCWRSRASRRAVVLGLARDRPVGDGRAVRRRLRLRARRARARRHRDGLPPHRGDAQPGGARARPRRRSPRRRGSAARRCSSAGCSPRRSTTSCWRSRSATARRPRCSRCALWLIERSAPQAAPGRTSPVS